jgi:hypothetical protein
MLRNREGLSSAFGRRPRPADNDPADSAAQEWLDAFLPIAESWTDPVLIVDLRPAMQDYADGAVWPGTRLAAQVPRVADGRLIWVGLDER